MLKIIVILFVLLSVFESCRNAKIISGKTQTNSDSTGFKKFEDLIKITTETSIDTNVIAKGKKLSKQILVSDLFNVLSNWEKGNDDTSLKYDEDGLNLDISYDKKDKKVKFKASSNPDTILVHSKQKTVEERNVHSSEVASKKVSVLTKNRNVERKGTTNWTWICIVGIVLALLFLYILIRTYLPRFLKNLPNAKQNK